MSAFDFSFQYLGGAEFKLSAFMGKVLLIVNTASECGLTPQYEPLEQLYQKYKDQGLVVIGVPSNDFGGQEPGGKDEILSTCKIYHVSFPITEKVKVKGKDAHPFYQWASKQVGLLGRPKWNFHKYLIGRDGRLIEWFASTTSPMSQSLTTKVESALAEST